MDSARFAALVARLEAYARRSPGTYRFRVALLAALGYAYLIVILLVALGLLVVLVWELISSLRGGYLAIKGVIVLGVLVWTILQAMWVKFQPPPGVVVNAGQAPRLFALVDEVRLATGTPPFDGVLVNAQFNASVWEVPRLGIFGWPKHYLVVGLPLLAGVGPDHLRGVIAHEMGHRSGRHGLLAGWVYRTRAAWSRLLAQLHANRHRGKVIFEAFFKHYAPYFEAYSFVLARQQEYEADRRAAELTSPGTLGEALVAIEIGAQLYDHVLWGGVARRARTEPAPPASVHKDLATALSSGSLGSGARHLRAALARATDLADTHPALRDRLAALGVEPPAPDAERATPSPTAAEVLLEPALVEQLATAFDAEWRQAVEPAWRDAYRNASKARERLGVLNAEEHPSPQILRERAVLTEQVEGPDGPLDPLRAAVEALPGDTQLRFLLGSRLLEVEDESGVTHLEAAIAGDPLLENPAGARLLQWYRERGDLERAHAMEQRLQAHHDELGLAAAERVVHKNDPVAPHGLPADAVATLRTSLHMYDIRGAWLARKVVGHLPQVPYYILIVDTGSAWWKFSGSSEGAQLVQRLAAEFPMPGEGFIVLKSSNWQPLCKRIEALGGGSLIYQE